MNPPYTGERWGYCLRCGWTLLTPDNKCELCGDRKHDRAGDDKNVL